jgi:hypothetical protein
VREGWGTRLGIVGGAETLGQLEECFFFVLAGFNSLLDGFHQNPMMLAFVESHPSRSARRMGHPAKESYFDHSSRVTLAMLRKLTALLQNAEALRYWLSESPKRNFMASGMRPAQNAELWLAFGSTTSNTFG